MLTQRIGMLAEIAFDLEQTLLGCGASKQAPAAVAQQSLPRKTEQRVVLGGGPGEVAMFGHLPERIVPADNRAHPEPGEHHIDGKVSGALRAEQRLWFSEFWGSEVPVPGPEGVRLAPENFEQGEMEMLVGEIPCQPGFEGT